MTEPKPFDETEEYLAVAERLTQEAIAAQNLTRYSVIQELIEHAKAGKARHDSEAEFAAWTLEWLLVMQMEGQYWPITTGGDQ
jgi:hypothetical protein